MTVKLFNLGLPGSGKSTTSRHIVDYVKHQHKVQSAHSINDYEILFEMFEADIYHKQFIPTKEYIGFDVVDLTACDTALKRIEIKALDAIRHGNKPDLIVIEFSRNDYNQAFKQFNQSFFQDAYFLFLEADKDICKQRIRDRVANPRTKDDHFVSEFIFQSYYDKYSGHHLLSSLNTTYGIDGTKIRVINNNGQFEDTLAKINEFIDLIFEQEGNSLVITSP